MLKLLRNSFLIGCVAWSMIFAQEPAASTAKPLQRITGAITRVDETAHTVTVTEDKTGRAFKVELQNTRSLRKVDPSTLDLKKATRITPEDLQAGDRVQVFASPAENDPNVVEARAVILISARDLQSVHQEQTAAWQHSTGGVVTSVDAAGQKIAISAHTPAGPKPVIVDVAKADFTRYSLSNPKTPASSKLADIQPGDQLRVLGDASADGSTITARRVYSSPVRMLLCTVSAVSADGKQITAKDLQRKQSIAITLSENSTIRKLPPQLAYGLARRLNPNFKPAEGAGSDRNVAGAPAEGAKAGEASLAPDGVWKGGAASGPQGPGANGPGGGANGAFRPGSGMRNGDLSQLLDRLPKISATDLKPGDALVIAGIPGGPNDSQYAAINVIAGVEPIFQSASPRQMESFGDWGTSLGGGGMDTGMSPQ